MIFVYKAWDDFCKQLKEKEITSIPACEVKNGSDAFFVLKHDIEDAVPKALQLAEIEHKYGHRGSYYAHAHLLNNPKNVKMLMRMKEMGHEISYHYDVMDSNHGNIDEAIQEFDCNIKKFKNLGFQIKTVCQHGNPIVERIGYTSNRDFFRNKNVQKLYPYIADIMVNYKKNYNIDYVYYSDAGRKFTMIYDPINNDIVNSDDKNVVYDNLEQIISTINACTIISTHPHRWAKSKLAYIIKDKIFFLIKRCAKFAIRIPLFKKIMSKYYYLAKKI